VRFAHDAHRSSLEKAGLSPLACVVCHTERGADRMDVSPAVAGRCFDCHGQLEHLASENDCAKCHRPLAEAVALTEDRVARLPKPPSHMEAGFAEGGHGARACPGGGSMERAATTNCAVCHAREFCEICHVDAPEQACIARLSNDPRSVVQRAALTAPPSHLDDRFLTTHGHGMTEDLETCGVCHTQESCRVCHVATPGVASTLPSAGPGRGKGAIVARRPPPSHGLDFRHEHGVAAAADPASCAGCHHRAQCLDCHRTDPAAAPGYHPADFLARHPIAAFSRETSCADCHDPGSFCKSCHESAGLVSMRTPIGAGFHDAKDAFLVGHGPAARMSLESCVSCHAERDCLVCHSETSGRGFNPHGPEFDAEHLRKVAPQMCTVCHGAAVPK
jgi:hypothetical protein